jgi:hypothetical protein
MEDVYGKSLNSRIIGGVTRTNGEFVQVSSDPICNSSGCTQYLHPKPSKAGDYPMDYPVPNFGIDVHDVATTFNSLDVAESMLKHRWNYDPSQKPKPEEHTEYNFEPALDHDVVDSNAHADLAEKIIAEQAKKQEEAKKGEEEKKAEEAKKPEEEKKTEEKTALQVKA